MIANQKEQTRPRFRTAGKDGEEARDTEHGYRAAKDLTEVVRAWRSVYGCYLRIGLISENPHGIHLVPQALNPTALVVIGLPDSDDEADVATISAYADFGDGLPLDAVYRTELDRLRRSGRAPYEVGLFADRRGDSNCRTLDTKLALMRWVYYYGFYSGLTDLVIGVHPHHAKFYERIIGLRPFGAETTCPYVNDAPVVGLKLDLKESLTMSPRPKGIRYFLENPLLREEISDRYVLRRSAVAGTVIEAFLEDRRKQPAVAPRAEFPWRNRIEKWVQAGVGMGAPAV